jgi:putative membrane protein
MFWYGPAWVSLGSLVFWVLAAVAIVALVRFLSRDGQRVTRPANGPAPWHPAPPSPEQILAERFARGEIGEDEFHQRMAALRAEAPPRP